MILEADGRLRLVTSPTEEAERAARFVPKALGATLAVGDVGEHLSRLGLAGTRNAVVGLDAMPNCSDRPGSSVEAPFGQDLLAAGDVCSITFELADAAGPRATWSVLTAIHQGGHEPLWVPI